MFRGSHVLEVASGVGLTSVVAAMLAAKVTVTGRVFVFFLSYDVMTPLH